MPPPRQHPPQDNQREGATRFPRPPIVAKGPSADLLQPPKRRDPSLIYSETLFDLFGEEAVKRGVHLEIMSVQGAELTTDGGSQKRIFLSFRDPRCDPGVHRPLEAEVQTRNKRFEKRIMWLAINQTIKAALTAAFGTAHVINWVGWITLYTLRVPDNIKKREVWGIRALNKLPDVEPSFNYARAIEKRIAALKEPPNPARLPHTGAGEDAALEAEIAAAQQAETADDMTEEEAVAIEAAERDAAARSRMPDIE